MKQKIDITPSSSVYATYSRLSYQPWTALAEFLDNSTQSFFDHQDELLQKCRQDHVKVIIEESADGSILTIRDDAYGMELDDFKRAIILDKPPIDTSGRNEYGMGLKTAACWFGRKWTVISTQYNSPNGYFAVMDIDKLAADKDTFIEAEVFDTPIDSHYTIIKIENLQKKIIGRTVSKVKEFLSNIYRQDLRQGKIKIIYKDSPLNFVDPEIYEEILSDSTRVTYKKKVSFTVEHEGQQLPVYGFIAIRKKGSLQNAGFTLLRRGRVIVGGPEKNYRPVELFKYSNSYAYQRMFGELHMDNWPVTQAKDEFDWHNSGLEEAFITEILKFSEEYRKKSENISFRKHKSSSAVVDEAVNDLQNLGIIDNASTSPVEEKGNVSDEPVEGNDDSNIDYPATDEGIVVPTAQVHLEGPKTHNVSFMHKGNSYSFIFTLDTDASYKYWLLVSPPEEEGSYEIRLNMKHPFFIPFINDDHFGALMMKLAIALTLAEIDASLTSQGGLIEPSDIRLRMNDILESIAKKKNYDDK